MRWRKNKEKKIKLAEVEEDENGDDEELPVDEESKEDNEEDNEEEMYKAKIKELNKKIKDISQAEAKDGDQMVDDEQRFKLSREEMDIAANALANSEEYKLYRQVIVGKKVDRILQNYMDSIESKKQ